MPYRVTNMMLYRSITTNIQRNADKLYNTQIGISSAKRVNKPSDDPEAASRILHYRKTLRSIDQYGRNMDRADAYLSATETALNSAHNLITRARTLAVQGANDSLDAASRWAIGQEVRQLFDAFMDLTNESLDGRYLFGGFETRAKPLKDAGYYEDQSEWRFYYDSTRNKLLPLGDNAQWSQQYIRDIDFEIADGVRMVANLDGSVFFGDGYNGSRSEIIKSDTQASGWTGPNPGVENFDIRVGGSTGTMRNVTVNNPSTTLSQLAADINDTTTGAGDIVEAWVATDSAGNEILYIQSKGTGSNLDIDFPTSDTASGVLAAAGLITGGPFPTQEKNLVQDDVDDPYEVNIPQALNDLAVALENNDTDKINENLDYLVNASDQVEEGLGRVGARMKRIEVTREIHADVKSKVTEIMSKAEDLDEVQAITDMMMQQNIYQASLAAAARILPISLLNFL